MERISTDIHRSQNAAGKYHQRGIRNGEVTKTKAAAMKDISRECGRDKMFHKNYLTLEAAIMQTSEYDFEYLPIE